MKLNQELEVIIYLNPDGDFKIGGSLMDDGRLADRIGVLEEKLCFARATLRGSREEGWLIGRVFEVFGDTEELKRAAIIAGRGWPEDSSS